MRRPFNGKCFVLLFFVLLETNSAKSVILPKASGLVFDR
jgi:hypothetical protein